MRSVSLKYALCIWRITMFLVCVETAAAQVNPHTQIRWPASCRDSAGKTYNWVTDQCVDINNINVTTQVVYPPTCSVSGMVYDPATQTCAYSVNQIQPGAQIVWPSATCNSGSKVYSPSLNGCVATGTAGNPAPAAGLFQYNQAGVFGAVSGAAADTSGNVSQLGSVFYAVGNQTPAGTGNNGIVNSMATGRTVIADPSYATTEQPYSFDLLGGNTKYATPSMTHFTDLRQGMESNWYHDTGSNVGHSDTCIVTTLQNTTTGSTGWGGYGSQCAPVSYQWYSPGLNNGASSVGPGGWTVNAGIAINGVSNTPGISELISGTQIKAGIGDNVGHYFYNYNYGGAVAGADEGNHLAAEGGGEAANTYMGTITTGGANATTVIVNCTKDCNAPGDGRYLVDTTAVVSGNATAYTAPSGQTPGTYAVDITVTPSTFWGTLAANVVTPTGAPFGKGSTPMTFTVNSGSGNTGSPVANALVCFAGQFHEQARITSVSGTGPWTITVPLRHAHQSGSWIMQGGPCGQFLSFTANEVAGGTRAFSMEGVDPNSSLDAIVRGTNQTLRYPEDIIGATDAHTLQFRFFTPNYDNLNYLGNVQFARSSFGGLSNTGGVVTFANTWITAGSAPYFFGAGTITISNSTNSAFNGACTNPRIASSGYQLSCDQAASTGQSSATATVAVGTSQYGNTAFHLYPGAEVLDVLDYNATNCTAAGRTAPCIDGTFTIEPNPGSWTVGDTVENTHHYSAVIDAERQWLSIYNPMLQSTEGKTLMLSGTGAGGNLQNQVANYAAYTFDNTQSLTTYAYHGGTVMPPGGLWLKPDSPGRGVFMFGLGMVNAPDPPGSPLLYVGCPATGCNDAQYWYKGFWFTGNTSLSAPNNPFAGPGESNLLYWPNTNVLQFESARVDFNYAPISRVTVVSDANGNLPFLTFNYIDSGAASHTARVDYQGTVNSTFHLPALAAGATKTLATTDVFGASGTNHAAGLVPDPGATAGSTNFLREDGTWAPPAGILGSNNTWTGTQTYNVNPGAGVQWFQANNTFAAGSGQYADNIAAWAPNATAGSHLIFWEHGFKAALNDECRFDFNFQGDGSASNTDVFECWSNLIYTVTPSTQVVAFAKPPTNIILTSSTTTTAAAYDNTTLTGLTISGHCAISAGNASAATNIATAYVTANSNYYSLNHASVAGMIYNVICTGNY